MPVQKVGVIGLGAMGLGMALALVDHSASQAEQKFMVSGFDLATAKVDELHQYASSHGVASSQEPPKSMLESVSGSDVIVVMLVNETQCAKVFEDLKPVVEPNSCIVLCSTVSPSFAREAYTDFSAKSIHFIDAPVSGGTKRARDGTLSMMVSLEEQALEKSMPIIQAMGGGTIGEVHLIKGGIGMGSTVKMVHQALAGVHIAVAAEALHLAAKSGVDVEQMYKIVCGAAGSSWMFGDRGQRMIQITDEVKSSLAIFVKDLNIVKSGAAEQGSPIPISLTALEMFEKGMAMGLQNMDDSQVVKVYEKETGVEVAKPTSAPPAASKESKGEISKDFWLLDDGRAEKILEVGEEPRHHILVANEYTRVMKVQFPPGDTTIAHRHSEDSLYFFLVEGGLKVINHVMGNQPMDDGMEYGEVRYGTHKSDKPLVHKITNKSNGPMLCIDAEVIKRPPLTTTSPLVADKHVLVKTRDKCRVYKLTLQPGESTTVTYAFFHLTVVLREGKIMTQQGPMGWEQTFAVGDSQWREPAAAVGLTNVGDSVFESFIAEWI